MEYIAIESQALKAVTDKIGELMQIVERIQAREDQKKQDQWIENTELAQLLQISMKTLQGYRERGTIGYSIIGRKIYYIRSEVATLLGADITSKQQ